jgi:hypothetical protein
LHFGHTEIHSWALGLSPWSELSDKFVGLVWFSVWLKSNLGLPFLIIRFSCPNKKASCFGNTGCVRKNETPVHFFTNLSFHQKVFVLEKNRFYKNCYFFIWEQIWNIFLTF